jgi:hypothetical protein
LRKRKKSEEKKEEKRGRKQGWMEGGRTTALECRVVVAPNAVQISTFQSFADDLKVG